MACATVFDALRIATESLGPELYLRAYWRDVWMNLIPRGVYPKHTGMLQSVFTIGRNEPESDEETWLPFVLTQTGNGTACDTTWNDTYVGETEVTYAPEHFELQGPVICKDELIFGFQPQAFWEKYMVGLTKRSRRSISNRLAKIYMDLVPKRVASTTYTRYDQTNYILPESTCELTMDMLDNEAQTLMEDGATDPNTNGWIGLGQFGPLFTLYIGMDAMQKILKNNTEFRTDIRYAFEGDGEAMPLMKRLAAAQQIKNWRFLVNLYPPRYNYVGGAYVRVNTWVKTATSKGFKADINPSWLAASHEAAQVLSPWVYTEEVVEPENQVAGYAFNADNYYGEWNWITGGRNISTDASCYDPTHKYGRHFAEYKHAAKPVFPEFGRWIVYKRCVASFECVTCS